MIGLFRFPHTLLVLILLISLGDISADYFFGDQNGIIGRGAVSKVLLMIQYLLFIGWLLIMARQRKRVIFIQIAFVLVLWGLLEIAAYVALHRSESPIYYAEKEIYLGDANLGLVPKPNVSEFKSEHTTNGDSVFAVTYHTDAFGRRVSPHRPEAQQYALFFGGSFVFGEGVSDEQSLPVQFSTRAPQYNTYNYGFNSYGPHHMLAMLRSRRIVEEVPEQEGVGIYVFIYDHLRRVYGNMSRVTSFGWNAPHYALRDGELERIGNFDDSRPYFIRRWLQRMDFSYVLHHLGVDWPLRIGEEHYRLTAAVIEALFEEYRRQFGNDNFYVLVFPGQPNEIIEYIQDERIGILDYSGLYQAGEHVLHRIDQHPNAEGYAIVAEQLAQDLQ